MSTRRKKSDDTTATAEGTNPLHLKLEKLPLAEKVAAFKFLQDSIETDRKVLQEQLALIGEKE